MTEIRRFTDSGLDVARKQIDKLRRGEATDIESFILDDRYTEVLIDGIQYEVKDFKDRMEAAEFFFTLLAPLRSKRPDLELDAGLWSWLAFKWLPVLAPADPSTGGREIKSTWYYVMTPDDYRSYYRHYLSGPYRIYKAHEDNPEAAFGLLATAVNRPGEIVEQIASQQEIISNTTLVEVVTRLYVDPKSKTLKRGAAGNKGGSARRLAAVLAQFDLTWDTYAMTPQQILNLLPKEFAKFT